VEEKVKQQAIGSSDVPRLEKLRDQIDGIDGRILSLLCERQEIASEIGKEKRNSGLEVFDSAREQEVLRRLISKNRGSLSPGAIRSIFNEIISAARAVQQTKPIAYLGPEGSFCHEAALSFFGRSPQFQGVESVEGLFSLVEKGVCEQGVVPVENSYEGSVNNTLDLFYRYALRITAEIFGRIRHHLLGKEKQGENITCLYSHPMALAQCRFWLKAHLPDIKVRETQSTSAAARLVADEPGACAIGSRLAGSTYGLKVIEESIEDHPGNVTRFVVMGKTGAAPTSNDKTSILFSVPHKAGALLKALEPLSRRGINMTRIESRPSRLKNWEYLFYVDVEGHEMDEKVSGALKEMEAHCAFLKRLGSYPAGGAPWG
jgi:chorismate mutase / prephenate dehydratase